MNRFINPDKTFSQGTSRYPKLSDTCKSKGDLSFHNHLAQSAFGKARFGSSREQFRTFHFAQSTLCRECRFELVLVCQRSPTKACPPLCEHAWTNAASNRCGESPPTYLRVLLPVAALARCPPRTAREPVPKLDLSFSVSAFPGTGSASTVL